eukprot:TRINITY_DN10990_c0_g1_i2.p1 TRINITY_DN10990_c0_g1~~TRINITY_DN10990_c0_g1_i2.p1  ORF type:complete len:513 (-),score=84.00 TRINITY_DN10990_c0_g1_i2:17-1345(-)
MCSIDSRLIGSGEMVWSYRLNCSGLPFVILHPQKELLYYVASRTLQALNTSNGAKVYETTLGSNGTSLTFNQFTQKILVTHADQMSTILSSFDYNLNVNWTKTFQNPLNSFPLVGYLNEIYLVLSNSSLLILDGVGGSLLNIVNSNSIGLQLVADFQGSDFLILKSTSDSLWMNIGPNGKIISQGSLCQHCDVLAISNSIPNGPEFIVSTFNNSFVLSWNGTGVTQLKTLPKLLNAVVIYPVIYGITMQDGVPVVNSMSFTNTSFDWNMPLGEQNGSDYKLSINTDGSFYVSTKYQLAHFVACGGHGTLKGSLYNLTCECQEGWLTEDCSLAYCNTTSCNAHQVCNTSSHFCECLTNYYGKNCDIFCNDATTCLSHGSCTINGTCHCHMLWIGPSCSEVWLWVIVCMGYGIIVITFITMLFCMIRLKDCRKKEEEKSLIFLK